MPKYTCMPKGTQQCTLRRAPHKDTSQTSTVTLHIDHVFTKFRSKTLTVEVIRSSNIFDIDLFYKFHSNESLTSLCTSTDVRRMPRTYRLVTCSVHEYSLCLRHKDQRQTNQSFDDSYIHCIRLQISSESRIVAQTLHIYTFSSSS